MACSLPGTTGWPRGHRIPYTGDEIALRNDEAGGPYVLQTKRGAGIDAARRNCGLGRWVNDPRGAVDEQGARAQANCEFVLHTPPGSGQRVAAVRTLRPILRGEELLVRYGRTTGASTPRTSKQKSKQASQRTRKRGNDCRDGSAPQQDWRQHSRRAREPGADRQGAFGRRRAAGARRSRQRHAAQPEQELGQSGEERGGGAGGRGRSGSAPGCPPRMTSNGARRARARTSNRQHPRRC